MSRDEPVTPANWDKLWDRDAVAFLKPLIKQIQLSFIERDYEVFLQLWQPGVNPRGSFVSMGIRKPGKQKNGNRYSTLFAYGFFYESARNWPEGYIDYRADRAIEEYNRFLAGEWPTNDLQRAERQHDDETLKRNANVSSGRKTFAHHGNAAVAKISPTKDAHCDVKRLNRQMEKALAADPWDAIEAPVDPWDAIEQNTENLAHELEVDPLS